MSELSLPDLPLPALMGLIAGGIYLIGSLRSRPGRFSLLDTLILVSIMGIVTAVTAPILGAAGESARSSALKHNLHTLRQQIELYKVEHAGKPPLLFKGSFPQLVHATNSAGVPGPRGRQYPFGPYLPGGIPINPYTGSPVVELTATFPPDTTTGSAGWLYHQQTGRITPDMPEGFDGQPSDVHAP